MISKLIIFTRSRYSYYNGEIIPYILGELVYLRNPVVHVSIADYSGPLPLKDCTPLPQPSVQESAAHIKFDHDFLVRSH
jgi:hypothetical protein